MIFSVRYFEEGPFAEGTACRSDGYAPCPERPPRAKLGVSCARIALRQRNREKRPCPRLMRTSATPIRPLQAHSRHAVQHNSKAHISRGHGAFRLFSMAQVRITRELPHTEPPRRRHRLNGTPQTRRCSGCRRERSIFTGMLHSTCTAWLPNPTRPGETLQNTRSSREQVVPRRSKRNIEDRIAQRNAAGGRNLAGRTA